MRTAFGAGSLFLAASRTSASSHPIFFGSILVLFGVRSLQAFFFVSFWYYKYYFQNLLARQLNIGNRFYSFIDVRKYLYHFISEVARVPVLGVKTKSSLGSNMVITFSKIHPS